MLHVHRSASGEALTSALAEVLRQPLADPLAPDVVAVPAKGVERWLSQRLAHHLGAVAADGVTANLEFPTPAAVLDQGLVECSPELEDAIEAWAPEAVTWTVLEVLDALPDEPAFAAVRHYLSSGSSRRWALAAKTARIFDSYAQDRPELLREWLSENEEAPEGLGWQPRVWRTLRERIGQHPVELRDDALAALRARAKGGRPCIYGLSRITKARLDILAALAESQDVHLFIHHPGSALWRATGPAAARRADDTSGERISHPLLRSLSRDVRELQQRLLAAVPDLVVHDHDHEPTGEDLLHRLQRDLRTDTLPADRPKPEANDRSVQVHACHGAARQVEVLREAVLQVLKDDPTLEPRDVLVMCPDVEHYAPLIKAVFDTDSHPGGRLRVSIADRSPRQTNPLLDLLARLLELAGSRLTGAQVLDLAGTPAVREKLRLSDDDLEQLRGWTVGAHVHWGLDAQHRERWHLKDLDHGTWRAGIDRLLAGVAMGGAEQPWQGVMPHDGIDSTDVELAGRFAELLDRLDAAVRSFEGAKAPKEWADALQEAVLSLGGTPWDGAWQETQLRRELDALREAATSTTLAPADVRVLMEQRLAGRPTRTSFRTGAMTVCTLTPMRSVPHKVICLLGMDDTAFPRHGIPDGDDWLARDPRIGERDPRSEDRQLFLDAILAAQQHLIITYSGADVRTGAQLQPAVPVGELLDALELTADGAKEHVVTRHPLQPFDPRNFMREELGAVGPFSFDQSAHRGARALASASMLERAFLDGVLPEPSVKALTLKDLTGFWEHPARGFLRQRLDVTFSSREDEPQDSIIIELDGLQEWHVGDRVLRARLRGDDVAAIVAAERACGELPPDELGTAALRTIGGRVDTVMAEVSPYLQLDERSEEVTLDVAGWSLAGAVTGIRGDAVVHVGYSNVGPRQRLRAWVDLLVLTATTPGEWRAVVIGRSKDKPVHETYGPIPRSEALAHLELLVALREVGLRTPLPVPLKAAAAYAGARAASTDVAGARDKAKETWESSYFERDDREPEHCLVWGDGAPFSCLWEWASPLPLQVAVDGETTDFARIACAVWLPLLEAER